MKVAVRELDPDEYLVGSSDDPDELVFVLADPTKALVCPSTYPDAVAIRSIPPLQPHPARSSAPRVV